MPLVALTGSSFKKFNITPEALGVSSQDMKLLTEAPSEEGEGEEVEPSEEDEELALDAEGEGEEKPKKRRRRLPRNADIETRLAGKFVNLVDLLPALPEKGKFDVQLIKDSQYFFS